MMSEYSNQKYVTVRKPVSATTNASVIVHGFMKNRTTRLIRLFGGALKDDTRRGRVDRDALRA